MGLRGKIILSVLIILVALVVFLVFTVSFQNRTSTTTTTQTTPSLELTKSILLKKIKLHFPEAQLFTTISKAAVPNNLLPLILQDATNTLYQKILYSDQRQGYYFVYHVQRDIASTDTGFLELLRGEKNLKILKAIRANLLGVIEAENNDYQFQILESFQQNQSTNIEIQVLKKL